MVSTQRMLLLSSLFIAFISTCYGAKEKQWNGENFPVNAVKDLIDNVFQSRAEITVTGGSEKDTIVYVDEFYDHPNIHGRLDILDGGMRYHILYDANTDEYMGIHGYHCDVLPLEFLGDDPNVNMAYRNWTDITRDSNGKVTDILLGPSALLRKALRKIDSEELVIKKMDKANLLIREIQAVGFEMQGDDGSNILYYFTDLSWTTPYQRNEVETTPIRIEVEHPHGIKQIIDFVYFEPNASRADFQIIHGVGCEFKNFGKKEIPKIGSTFSFLGEIFDEGEEREHVESAVYVFQVFYNEPLRLARLDSKSKSKLSIAKIDDYNTGISYIQTITGECIIAPIEKSIFEIFAPGDDTEKMKTSNDFLGLTLNYYYLGKAYARGMFCDVWETVIMDAHFMNSEKPYKKLVLTWFFASEEVTERIEGEIQEQVPLALFINGYDEDGPKKKPVLLKDINIFRFNQEPIEHSDTFNVEACFPDRYAKMHFQLEFESSPKMFKQLMTAQQHFEAIALQEIRSATKIGSALRIPYIESDYSEDTIYLTGLMLEKPPALSLFNLKPDPTFPHDKQTRFNNVNRAEECAAKCLTNSEKCRSFAFCGHDCYTSEVADEYVDARQVDASIKACAFYSRVALVSDWANEPDMNTALANLEKVVNESRFEVPIQFEEEKDLPTSVKAKKVTTNLKPFKWDLRGEKYEVVYPQQQIKTSETTLQAGDSSSEVECYRKCINEDKLACKSFSYCPATRSCRVSSLLMFKENKVDQKELEKDTHCQVFSRSYIQMFREEIGSVIMVSADKDVKSNTAEECAMHCIENADLPCKSFEYCTGGFCKLHKIHGLDMTNEKITGVSECTHFSYLYSGDFDDLGRTLISDPQGIPLQQVSSEECARSCSELDQFECVSFDFCPASDDGKSDSTCLMSSKSIYEFTDYATVTDTCQHYERKKGLHTEGQKWGEIRSRIVTDIIKTGHTTGQLVGIIFGTLIFGIICGAAMFILYSYYRSKKDKLSGTSVRFVKHENPS